MDLGQLGAPPAPACGGVLPGGRQARQPPPWRRHLQAAREIAHTVAGAANRVYLQADTLLLNLANDAANAKK